MKKLLLLMIVLSVFGGIYTNKGAITLYSAEFLGPISLLKANMFPAFSMIHWGVLLLSHALMVSLVFLTKKGDFNFLLAWFPLQFILVFVTFDLISSFFLIPFIIVWVIALIVRNKIT